MRTTQFAEGEFYHLYNRGVDKRTIFKSPAEYKRFVAYLYLMNDSHPSRLTSSIGDFLQGLALQAPTTRAMDPGASLASRFPRREPLVAIGAYCLMPNHFHLYVTPLVEGGISKFMHRVQTAYTMYFNKRHERTGALFQGTFKARHVDDDTYAKYLFSYIHLNPAKLKEPTWKELGVKDLRAMGGFLRNYKYSSLGEYTSGQHIITDPKKFPEYFTSAKEVDDHIDFWLEGSEQFPQGLTSRTDV